MESTSVSTRRQLFAGAAIALGGLAAGCDCWADPQQSTPKDVPIASAKPARTSLHYHADLKASPQRVYEVLLDPKLFAAMTGQPAEIDPRPGGAFSLFSKQIEGMIVELVPNLRVVQAWRPTHWDPGVYSIVRFALAIRGAESMLDLDQVGFPESRAESLDSGWHEHYLEPLRKYFP